MKIAWKILAVVSTKTTMGHVQQNVIYSIGEMISCVLLILKFSFYRTI